MSRTKREVVFSLFDWENCDEISRKIKDAKGVCGLADLNSILSTDYDFSW
jgi:hypothetical protein